MVQVLAATGPFFLWSMEETFELIADAGFDGVELMVTQDRGTQDAARVLEVAARYGLAVPALHGPFLLLTRSVFGTDPHGKVERSVELARIAGIRVVVIHPPLRWQLRYAQWLPDRIAEIESRLGVAVAVENMFPVRLGQRVLEFHEGVDLATLAQFPFVTLDTSHLAVAGIGLLEAAESVGTRLVHTHVSNNAGLGHDDHAPLDEGVLAVGPYLERLASGGFTGRVTLELDIRRWGEDRGQVLEGLRHNLALARGHLAAGLRRAPTA